ncbi:MAG: hypothetical protein AB8C95_15435, partial [Phycisphaeraceae bacterium]
PNRFSTGYWFDQRHAGQYLPSDAAGTSVTGGVLACPNDDLAVRVYCLNMWSSSSGFNGDAGKLDVIGELFDADVINASSTMLAGEGWAKWGSTGRHIAGAGFGELGNTPGVRFTGDVGNTTGSRYSGMVLPTQINWTLHGNNQDPSSVEGRTHFTYVDGHVAVKQQSDLVDAAGLSTLDTLWSPMDEELNVGP